MHIGIEARWMSFERTGFGNYAGNLLREMILSAPDCRFTVYLNREYNVPEVFGQPNVEKRVIRQIPELYKHIGVPLDIARRGAPQIFHFLYNAPSLFFPWPMVLTIHDMSYRHIPRMISLKNLISINIQLMLSAKKCKRIITVSENSKKDIIRYLGIHPEKIDVIYEGVDPLFGRVENKTHTDFVRKKYNLPDKFLLYVGTYLPHKNLPTLIDAYGKIKSAENITQKLVLAGKQGRNFDSIKNHIQKQGLSDLVKCIGYVDDSDLAGLYSLADLFIYPSLYEGFGLPLLEAMACGVPIVSSNASCLPEIGGDACRYFDPESTEKLAEAITSVLKNKAKTFSLVSKGFENLKRFSWKKASYETIDCYKKVMYCMNKV